MATDVKEMTESQLLTRVVRLGFEGDWDKFEAFKTCLRDSLPPGTGVALRGSVITNEKWATGECFDHAGPGTSDLDVALIGDEVMECWDEESFYLPRIHTKPLSDKTPEAAPVLNSCRQRLQTLAGRPVNFQATSNFLLFVRDVLLNQPYFMIVEPAETEPETEAVANVGQTVVEDKDGV